jgi:hypothetical protein
MRFLGNIDHFFVIDHLEKYPQYNESAGKYIDNLTGNKNFFYCKENGNIKLVDSIEKIKNEEINTKEVFNYLIGKQATGVLHFLLVNEVLPEGNISELSDKLERVEIVINYISADYPNCYLYHQLKKDGLNVRIKKKNKLVDHFEIKKREHADGLKVDISEDDVNKMIFEEEAGTELRVKYLNTWLIFVSDTESRKALINSMRNLIRKSKGKILTYSRLTGCIDKSYL